jgi:hypothetical protein
MCHVTAVIIYARSSLQSYPGLEQGEQRGLPSLSREVPDSERVRSTLEDVSASKVSENDEYVALGTELRKQVLLTKRYQPHG